MRNLQRQAKPQQNLDLPHQPGKQSTVRNQELPAPNYITSQLRHRPTHTHLLRRLQQPHEEMRDNRYLRREVPRQLHANPRSPGLGQKNLDKGVNGTHRTVEQGGNVNKNNTTRVKGQGGNRDTSSLPTDKWSTVESRQRRKSARTARAPAARP